MKFDLCTLHLKETPGEMNHVVAPLEVTLTDVKSSETCKFQSKLNLYDTNNFLNVNISYFEELFLLNKISYWQFMPSYIWPDIYFVLELVKILTEIKEKYKPQKIIILDSDDRFNKIWFKVTKEIFRDCDLIYKRNNGLNKLKNSFGWIGLYRAKMRMIEFFSSLIGLLSLKKETERNGSPGMLFVSMMSQLRSLKDEPYQDIRVTGLKKKLQDQNYITWSLPAPTGNFYTNKKITDDLLKSDENFIPYLYIHGLKVLSGSDWLWIAILLGRLRRNKKELKFEGIDVYPFLSSIFFDIIVHFIPQCMRHLKASKAIVKKYNPQKIVLYYETGPVQRAFLITAHKNNIQSIGLQHGMIFSNHYDYMHAKVGPDCIKNGFIIPKILCVFGNFWKDILTQKGNYPKDSICVVGDWTKACIIPDYSNKKKIAVLSNAIDTVNFFTNIEKCLENYSFDVVFRTHPTDDKKKIQEYFKENKKMKFHSGSLEDLLKQSMVSISAHSTTVLESMAFDSQPIIVDFHNVESYEEFKSMPGIIHAENEKTLHMELNKIINNEKIGIQNNFIKNIYENFGDASLKKVIEVVL